MRRLNLPSERTFTGPALVWKRVAAFLIDIAIINLFVLFPFRSLFQNMFPKDYSFSEAYNLLGTSMGYTKYISSVSFAMSIRKAATLFRTGAGHVKVLSFGRFNLFIILQNRT